MNPGLELLQGSGAVEELKNIRRGIEKKALGLMLQETYQSYPTQKGWGQP